MKKNIPFLTLAATYALASMAFAEIVIKPVRSPTVSTNRPGIIVPGPNGGAVTMGQKPQVIELLNGDALQGTFVEFNSEGGIKWRHPAAKNDIEFAAESVSRILLHPRATQVADKQNCRVTLRTGEELLGELIELDENYLLLGAWYSRNSLRIPRGKIFSIAPGGQAGNTIYAGPKNLDGWTGRNLQGKVNQNIQIRLGGRGRVVPNNNFARPLAGKAGWQFSKESFISTMSGSQIGRKVKFADKTNIEFDLSWRGSFNIAIHLYSDKMEQYGSNGYIVGLSNYNCYLIRSTAKTGHNNIGNVNLPQEFRGKTKARISIRVDRENNSVTLLMNDRIIRQWTDSAGFVGKGDVLMFLSQGQAMIKINKISITEWDGKMPAPGGSERKTDEDRLRGADSDFSGKLVGIANGKVQFKASFAEVNMPVEKVTLIRFAGEKKEKTKLGIGDVKVTLVGGGDFYFRLERWTVDKITGISPVFGKVDFRPSAFSSVEFNLNKKRESGGDDPFDF